MAYSFSPLPEPPPLSSESNRLSFSDRRLYFQLGSPWGWDTCPEEPMTHRQKRKTILAVCQMVLRPVISEFEGKGEVVLSRTRVNSSKEMNW